MGITIKRGPQITEAHKKRFADESVCNDCGGCCYLSFELGRKTVIVRDLPCKNLRFDDEGKSLCAIYERRLETDYCHRVTPQTVRWGLFPGDCPYVEDIKGYRGKIYLDEHPEYKERIVEEYGDTERPDFIRARDWRRFFGRRRH